METRKKSYTLLIIGAVLLAASLIFTIYAHGHSYADSIVTGTELSDVKGLLKEIEAGEATGDVEALKIRQAELSDLKLSQERPYSYGLTMLFLSLLLAAKGLYNAVIGTERSQENIKRLALAGLMAALCYIGFAVFKIDIPVGPGKTAFHFGNVFCVLAALLLGGFWGGLAGAIGMTIGDLTTAYVTSAPKTFLLKLCIGLIVGLVAHNIFKLSRTHSKKYITGVTILACVCGMGFNMVADPLVGYFYKMYLLGVPQELSAALAKMATVTTAVNAIVAIIAASIFYLALRPALRKANLFIQVTPEKEDMN
ncbi:MAG: ECF transporter S component [Muribaculum sp.]|nr:ECF transporter S component [Muribaculum sp.]